MYWHKFFRICSKNLMESQFTNTRKLGIDKQNFYKEVGKNSNLTNITHLDFKKTFEFMCKKYKKDRKIFIDYK